VKLNSRLAIQMLRAEVNKSPVTIVCRTRDPGFGVPVKRNLLGFLQKAHDAIEHWALSTVRQLLDMRRKFFIWRDGGGLTKPVHLSSSDIF